MLSWIGLYWPFWASSNGSSHVCNSPPKSGLMRFSKTLTMAAASGPSSSASRLDGGTDYPVTLLTDSSSIIEMS